MPADKIRTAPPTDGPAAPGRAAARPAPERAERFLDCLAPAGEMGGRIRAFDWSATPIGPIGQWPQPLKTLVSVMLGANQPMFVAWGPGRTLLYNDAYAEVLAKKHPALGWDFLEVWPEIRAELAPLVERAYRGEPSHGSDIELIMHRKGYPERTHWAYSYTPVHDEGGAVAGFFCPCHEITGQVLAERRQRLLVELGQALPGAGDPREAMVAAVTLLGRHLKANRVGYGEVQTDDVTVVLHSCFADGVAPLEGSYRLDSFGPEDVARQRRGLTQWSDDLACDPDQDPAVWAAIDTRSYASVPLVRDGRFVASLYVNFREPHVWTPDEIALVEQVAARTWGEVERARAEARLRESEGRLRFLNALDEALRASSDSRAAMRVAAELLAHRLGASRCAYAAVEADNDAFVIHDDFTAPGLASSAGRYSLDLFGPRAAADMRAGRTLVVRDVSGELAPGDGREMFQAIAIEAIVCCPLVKEGRLVAMMAVHQDRRREWRAEEIALVETVVERCWAHVERVGAEARLRASEARFRGVFDSRLMGLTVFDARSGETLAINDAFLAMTGHTRADFDEGRWDWRDFTIPDDLSLDERAIAQAQERGWWEPYEKEYRRRDGTRFPVRISSAPLAGEPGRVVVSVQDISEARAAEAELRRSEQRLQLAKQAADVGVWDWDLVTDEITWSPEMYDLLGVDPGTPAGRLYDAWAEALHPDDRAEAEPLVLETARRGGSFSFDFRRITASGETRWIRSQAVAVAGPDGAPVRLTGVNLDVTGQRQEEERLRGQAETLAVMVEERTRERDRIWRHSLDLLSVIDLGAGTFDAVNPAWTTALGWPVEAIEGRSCIGFVHPDDVDRSAEAFEQGRRGDPVLRFENRYRTKDGGWRWLSWVAVPEAGKLYCVTRDVTAEKDRQAELEAAQEALRQAQKMEAMGQLTGGVAHDFNNLLTPIVGALDMLQRKGFGGEREQRLIAGAAQSAERAKTLVQRLLAFARRQPLQAVPVDVARLVKGMGELVASTTGPQIKVVVDAPEDLPSALADPNQIEMALLNLAVNARDAMPDGGTLRISAQAGAVRAGHPSGLKPGPYVTLSVADTGSGMDEATLARAVEPFFSTKGVGKGTGLGLSMVHGLATQLGGALTLQSRPGLGTNVELWLPQSAAHAAASAPAPEPAPAAAHAGRALLVDDEALVRLSTADMLSELGYAVIEAASAEEALRRVRAGERFDLLVTDHLMPGMTGTDLARTVRSLRPDASVLLVSGYADAEGIDPDLPWLTKPFRKDELAASLAQLGLG